MSSFLLGATFSFTGITGDSEGPSLSEGPKCTGLGVEFGLSVVFEGVCASRECMLAGGVCASRECVLTGSVY